MIRPIDEGVATKNPEFGKLYETLTTSILNPDGSTQGDEIAKRQEVVREELKAHRIKSIRLHLLGEAIATAVPEAPAPDLTTTTSTKAQRRPKARAAQSQQKTAPDVPQLPEELLNLLLLLPPFLVRGRTMDSASLALLLSKPPFSRVSSHFPQLVSLVSTSLTAQATTLARVLSPNTNASYIHRIIPTIPSIITTLQTALSDSQTLLTTSRVRATNTLISYLGQHTLALQHLIRILELKHGMLANTVTLSASLHSLEAEAWSLASEALLWQVRAAVYPPEARDALANYKRHLADARMRLADGARVREAELADYGVGGGGGRTKADEDKERTMREMARVWREMETRLREVRADLDRLA